MTLNLVPALASAHGDESDLALDVAYPWHPPESERVGHSNYRLLRSSVAVD